jgi:hypothetical protein
MSGYSFWSTPPRYDLVSCPINNMTLVRASWLFLKGRAKHPYLNLYWSSDQSGRSTKMLSADNRVSRLPLSRCGAASLGPRHFSADNFPTAGGGSKLATGIFVTLYDFEARSFPPSQSLRLRRTRFARTTSCCQVTTILWREPQSRCVAAQSGGSQSGPGFL